jgi:uncharacterized paraquat-inducible protein A
MTAINSNTAASPMTTLGRLLSAKPSATVYTVNPQGLSDAEGFAERKRHASLCSSCSLTNKGKIGKRCSRCLITARMSACVRKSRKKL